MSARFILSVVCFVHFSVAKTGHAEEPRRILYVLGSLAPEELSAAVQAQVADLPATPLWHVEPAQQPQAWARHAETLAEENDVAAVMWLDISATRSELIVYLREHDETYVRRVPSPADYPMAARIEELSAMAREITLAVLEGRPVPLERLPRTFSPNLRVALGYRASALATSSVLHSAIAGVTVEPVQWLAVGLAYGYAAPLHLSESATRLRLQAQSLRAHAAFRFGGDRVQGGVGLTGTLQWTRRVTEALPSSAETSPATTNVELGVGPMLEGEVRLVSELSLVATLGVEAQLRRTHFEVHGATPADIVPWLLRPYAGLSVAWRFR
ncbi:MAG TPA: hypothetical protein VLC93_08940 [Myxococcota bacterium]|nr:hypothetical protein [Myxococcota bacterium]